MSASSSHSMMGKVVLGRYRVVAPLARGGMGIIYLGRLEGAAGFAKPVVIKTVIPEGTDSKGTVQLFVREARILSNLEHPSIVGVLDFGEVGSDYVMVLEYVHGFHLGAWSRFVRQTRGSMPVSHAVEVMLPVLDALDFAHALTRPGGTPLGIVHRDISPANILIDNTGHVKLHDFGIARMADDEFKTQDGTFRGTLSYTAPETLQGIAASPRSDLYGCAVVLYQLISGVNPFKGNTPSETLHRVLAHVPPSLSNLRGEVSENLAKVVVRAMAKDPAARFESAAELAAALRAARTWPESNAAQELAHTIQTDFNGTEMAKVLELEPLAVRDNAWRAAAGGKASLSSTPPPATAADSGRATANVQKSGANLDAQETLHAVPSSALLELARAGPGGVSPPYEAESTRDERLSRSGNFAPVEQAAPNPSRRSLTLLLSGAALVLLLGGAGLAAFGSARAPAEQHFLLIEKTAPSSSSDVSHPSLPTARIEVSASPVASPAASTALAGSTLGTAAKWQSSGVAKGDLSGAFQHQQGRIAGCFHSNASDATNQPLLDVRFKIDGAGKVQSAELSPAGIADSALGSCILGVARSTRFPGSGTPVTFAIPITAVRK